jgi:hypothetical protein
MACVSANQLLRSSLVYLDSFSLSDHVVGHPVWSWL